MLLIRFVPERILQKTLFSFLRSRVGTRKALKISPSLVETAQPQHRIDSHGGPWESSVERVFSFPSSRVGMHKLALCGKPELIIVQINLNTVSATKLTSQYCLRQRIFQFLLDGAF